ncbi:MAG: flagellar protein FliL [Clostridia bacterium]|nr:flagellar protein FliL [Clostridia bacterium]
MPPEETVIEESKKGRSPLVIIIILVLVVLLIGSGLAYYFFFIKNDRGGQQEPVNLEKMTMDSIVVNLQEPGLRRYLRTTITLEYADPELKKELEEKDYRIKDTINSILRSKSIEEIGNEKALKLELLAAINAQLVTGQIRGLYFEEFIVQ